VLDLFGRYYPDPRPTDELLALVGLRRVSSTPWRHLSGGEQQRLSLALALVGRPDVAFLDEPTAGVDPEGRLAVRAVVAGLKEQGVCVVLTTHELGEAETMADRIVIMAAGRVAVEGTPAELALAAGGVPVITFGAPAGLDAAARAALAAAVGGGVVVVETAPGRYRVEGDAAGTPAATAAVATFLAEKGAALTELVAGRTLEDVYFSAVGGAAEEEPAEEAGTGAGRRARGRGQARGRRRS
jgi:ABC-2 type transport system ATP-binding protein